MKLTKDQACKLLGLESRPARGAWIEIKILCRVLPSMSESRPARGAWIEISHMF